MNSLTGRMQVQYTVFNIIQFQLGSETLRTQTKELNDMFIHFFCLCPVGFTTRDMFKNSLKIARAFRSAILKTFQISRVV